MNLNLSRRILFKSKNYFLQHACYAPFRQEYFPKKKVRPNVYKSLKQRIEEDDYTQKDPDLYKPVNIGFPFIRNNVNAKMRRMKVNNSHLEKMARERKLLIDLDEVEDEWLEGTGPIAISNLANHYGIFKDLFGPFAYFYPTTLLNIAYDFDEETVSPVYFGNNIKPKEASMVPNVTYESKPDELWSILLISPDNNLLDDNMDCLHWFMGNITGNDILSGEVIMDYMQPFPPKGSGYHRYVFLLFKQSHKVDFSSLKQNTPCLHLEDRNFSTYGFYKENEEVFTPASICWFQSDWDHATRQYFHETLDMKEPIYEYQFPKQYKAPQKYFPKKRSFNAYMDLHRDPKDLAQEVLLERLANLHPFEEEKVPEFPGYIPLDLDRVIWEREAIKDRRLGFGKNRDIYRGRLRPELLPDNPI